MFVLMIDVGVVRMRVDQPLVQVAMSMRFAGRVVGAMFVFVMLVMNVSLCVFQGLVSMRVFMSFGGVKPDTRQHENARRAECPIQATLAESEGERGPRERRGREVSSCSSGAEMPESTDKENETQAIAKKTDYRCAECDACRWKPRAEAERERGVHEACAESLPHRDLRWIAA